MKKKIALAISLVLSVSLIGCNIAYKNTELIDKNQVQEDIHKEDEIDKEKIISLIKDFGSKLQMVSLLSPKDALEESMNENYGKFVTQELIDKWLNDPESGPGRLVSSPWPDRIEIQSIDKLSEDKYEVKGEIIEITSMNKEDEKFAVSRLVSLIVKKIDNKWLIQDLTLGEYNNQEKDQLAEKGIVKPEEAKKIIKETTDKLIHAISTKDSEAIVEFTHPVKGVRFTPYTHVSLESDIVFEQEQIKDFFSSQDTYLWGHYDGTGDDILLTPSQYYDKFIYAEDFITAEEIGYNEVLSSGNMLENQFEIYKNPIVVEYYFSGFNPEYAGIDWRSLRLVFEEYEGNWKLVGIINNQWTI